MACRLPLFFSCALILSAAANAAELGEPRVASYMGQPLVADIELNLIEHPGQKVDARLAHPEVYRGANIGMPHVLSTLSMSVIQRDGRQFLHITSRAPVESSHLHLYLELADGGQRAVRLATLWLTPDPNPAPAPPLPARTPPQEPAQAQAAAPAAVAVAAPAPARQPAKAVEAPAQNVVAKTPTPKPAPKEALKPVAKADSKPAPKPEPLATPAARPEPPAAPLSAPASSAACVPAAQPAPSAVCAALDARNVQLRAQIGQLEDRVKVLQVAMGAKPAELEALTPAAPKTHKRKKPAPEPVDETPWGWIAGGLGALLALAGGVVLARRRRKAPAAPVADSPKAGLAARLRQRFMRRKPAEPGVEPSLEASAHDTSTQV
ncbi:hypothetical protein B0920_11325 [Massilia sp. KIM]|uniref:type IV pilus assembly protein FimV n=1 Tax=Massilia sp. KIM TaxID=1955422 RepID=UPI00098FC7E5|nr:hypothetical protein [Massilia sp. KIM]OON63904.1 hypothetical protein B0920_11325 [Massilia sp. KIM]